jgi:hypothetical protein
MELPPDWKNTFFVIVFAASLLPATMASAKH